MKDRGWSGGRYQTIFKGFALRPMPVYRHDRQVLSPIAARAAIRQGIPVTEEKFPPYVIGDIPEGETRYHPVVGNEWVQLHVREMFPPDSEIDFSRDDHVVFVNGLPLVSVYDITETRCTEKPYGTSNREVPRDDDRLPWKYRDGSILS
jgi:hypothetical protein